MSRLFKTAVLYLLMLAIPIQGFAASTMLNCGTAHSHTMSGQETTQHPARDPASNLASDHRYPLLAIASLDSIDHALSDTAVNLTSGDGGLDNDAEPGSHNSSKHAACPLGAAVSASSPGLRAAEQAVERIIVSEQFLIIGFVTDGPKRPPRSFPA